MSHIDTLQVYKDYLRAGYTESQAEVAVHALNTAFDSVVTQKDLKILESHLKIFFSWIVGGALIVALIIPFIGKMTGLL